MAFAQSSSYRPIASAVATLGVSDRVAFLRRTYGHLGVALLAWAGLTAVIFRVTPTVSVGFSAWALKDSFHWLLIMAAFMGIGHISQRLASSETSRGIQYLGLGLTVVAWSFLLQPLLWAVVLSSDGGASFNPMALLSQAALITATIFVGLTLTVFITRKDFSFLRGALTVASFGALGVILASIAFGFSLGMLFSGAMILMMAGYILYQTSLVMAHFRPTQHVAAALMLFSTVAMLFWYVVRILLSARNR
jgi:uncharacterized protein